MIKPTVLYLDDEAENLSTLARLLRDDYDVVTAQSGEAALATLEKRPIDVVISDQRMPEMTGVDFLKEVSRKKLARLGIILTAYADFDALADAVNSGIIFRYLNKPVSSVELHHALKEGFEKIRLQNENEALIKKLEAVNHYLKEEIKQGYHFSLLADDTQSMRPVVENIKKVSKTSSTVLIRGESGVGKEVVARAIHEASDRAKFAFIRVNCGALSENLLESELFGHEKGAFTGALTRKIGRFEAADQGSIFLDEIGDISPKMQVNLLRVIQEKEFERVGASETIKVDVRIIAATHQNLEKKIREGSFREDLYFRLNVFPIQIPPLRDRLDDLENLTKNLIQKISTRAQLKPLALTATALEKIQAYDWPGNVRELENILERALILATGNEILPEDIVLDHVSSENSDIARDEPCVDLTKEVVEKALQDAGGNKVEAARLLGIKRPTLYYHMKRLHLNS